LNSFGSTSSEEAINTLVMPVTRGAYQRRFTILALNIFVSTSSEEAINTIGMPATRGE
jgi:hypothetical protein